MTTSKPLARVTADELERLKELARSVGDLLTAAVFAMGEAIVKILTEAGHAAGMGVDMDPGSLWVRTPG